MPKSNNSLDYYVTRWSLCLEGKKFETNTSLVYFVSYKGKPAVLKINHLDSDEHTAEMLLHYNGSGAIRLLEYDDLTTLMPRMKPGYDLRSLTYNHKDDEATAILCSIIKKLHQPVANRGAYPDTHEYFLEAKSALNNDNTFIKKKDVEEALETFLNLEKTRKESILLHGDLHHENILWDETLGWLAIDPKGIVGESYYEVVAFMRNPLFYEDLLRTDKITKKRLSLMSTLLGYDENRILQMAFCHSVLSAATIRDDLKLGKWFLMCGLNFRKLARERRRYF